MVYASLPSTCVLVCTLVNLIVVCPECLVRPEGCGLPDAFIGYPCSNGPFRLTVGSSPPGLFRRVHTATCPPQYHSIGFANGVILEVFVFCSFPEGTTCFCRVNVVYKVPKVINMSFKERRRFLLSPLDSDTYACFWILWLESRHVCPTCEVPFRAYFFWPINSSFFLIFTTVILLTHFSLCISERLFPNEFIRTIRLVRILPLRF